MDIKIASTEATVIEAINFENKRKMIFDCLNEASEKLVGTTLEQKTSPVKRQRTSSDQQDHRITKFNGKESIFKRPVAPIAKCLKPRQAPDYQVMRLNCSLVTFYLKRIFIYDLQINPHKWKKYSLSDADISDKSNTSAAFAFLKEIEARKSLANEMDCDDVNDNQDGKIVFNVRKRVQTDGAKFNKSVHLRSIVREESADPAIDLPKMKGSKVVMPEYVIGQKKERKKSTSKSSADGVDKKRSGMLKLNHLFEEDEDE